MKFLTAVKYIFRFG